MEWAVKKRSITFIFSKLLKFKHGSIVVIIMLILGYICSGGSGLGPLAPAWAADKGCGQESLCSAVDLKGMESYCKRDICHMLKTFLICFTCHCPLPPKETLAAPKYTCWQVFILRFFTTAATCKMSKRLRVGIGKSQYNFILTQEWVVSTLTQQKRKTLSFPTGGYKVKNRSSFHAFLQPLKDKVIRKTNSVL